MTRLLCIALLCIFQATERVQAESPKGVGFRIRCYALTGARIVVRPGQIVENGTIVVRDGIIESVSEGGVPPEDAEIIEAKGSMIYPGFLDAGLSRGQKNEQLPVEPPGRIWDTSRYVLALTPPDMRNGLTPQFEAVDRLDLNIPDWQAQRQAGITAVHLLPTGRIASGQGSLVLTSGAPLRETILDRATWGVFRLRPSGDGYPSTVMGATAHLRQALLDARRWQRQSELYQKEIQDIVRPEQDSVLEALSTTAPPESRVIFEANTFDEIHRSLNFCSEFGLKPIILGGADAHRCLDELKAADAIVLVSPTWGPQPQLDTHPDPNREPLRVQAARLARWKTRVSLPAELQKKEITWAFCSNGLDNPNAYRQALLQSIQHGGLSPEAALAGLTGSPAKFLGLDHRISTIEKGKPALFAIWNGPFEDPRAVIQHVFIDENHFRYAADAKPLSQSAPLAKLDGEWTLTLESDSAFTGKWSLNQDGIQLRGSFQSSQGNGTISGQIEGEQLRLNVSIGVGDRTQTLAFNCSISKEKPEELSGDLKTPFGGSTKWKALRTPTPKSKPNPVQITIESDEEKPALARRDDELPTELDEDRRQPSAQNPGNLFIKGATILDGRGNRIEQGSILIRSGKIAAIGKELQPDPGMTEIDATGKWIMPGIIDTHSHIMIDGINEGSRSIVCEVRIKDCVWTEDVSAYRALAGGTTTTRLLHGSANVIGGQDALVKLKYGKPAREQIQEWAPQGVKFALGENVKAQNGRFPNTRLGVEATLNRAFLEALEYRREWQEFEQRRNLAGPMADQLLAPRRDLRLEALADIINHQKFIHSHCYRSDEILMLLRVAQGFGIRVWSLQHVLEGYKVAPEIVAHGASCSTFADWWAYKVEAYDATPYNAALLQQAGANVVIKSDDWELVRHLYQEAAKTVRYGGMTEAQAIAAVTYNPARELGVSDRLGSLEVGKDADLAIYSGHPLNAFSRVEYTLVEGEVRFNRASAPTAMLPEAVLQSATPSPLTFSTPETQARKLDLTESPNGTYLLTGGTVHPVDAPEIPNGMVLIQGDKIIGVGQTLPVPEGTKSIDVTGLHVYPGLIDAGTTLGLIEIRRVTETIDTDETGPIQPDLRAGVALNPDSELIPVARAGGITSILTHPTGGLISGQASVMKLGGWTAPEMTLELEAGLWLNWTTDENQQKTLTEFLGLARDYQRVKEAALKNPKLTAIPDPRFDAMLPYLAGQKPVFIEADTRQAIQQALRFAETEKLKIVFCGGGDAWKLAAELKQRDIPVIIGPVMRAPISEFDPFDAPYANPGRLHAAGVRFCIRSDNASNSRNLPFEAAMAVAYGLPEAEGLASVTLSAAKILGLGEKLGSLTPGKLANVIVTDGSPLQPTTQYKAIFISGKPYYPESKQTRLYEKYRQRLKN